MNFPPVVSNREVTRRGVHLHPFPHHAYWCGDPERRATILQKLQDMGISWVVILTPPGPDTGAFEKFDDKTPVEWLLDAGIIPILRYADAPLPRPFMGREAVRQSVQIYARYGLKPPWILWNEPGNDREWKDLIVPPDWWSIFVGLWMQGAMQVLEEGGIVGFPDGPDYDFVEQHPFRDVDAFFWNHPDVFYSLHLYCKGRPDDCPEDPVSLTGIPLTEAEWQQALDDFWGNPDWMQPPLEVMNAQRLAKKEANPVLWGQDQNGRWYSDYTACWLAWKLVEYHARQILGFVPPLAVTEGGWVPRDRAGSGGDIDDRWALTTPKAVARQTVGLYEDSNFFAICLWLYACAFMGGSGFEDAAWWGWAWWLIYGEYAPVVQALIDNPPGDQARFRLQMALVATERRAVLLEAALASLGG